MDVIKCYICLSIYSFIFFPAFTHDSSVLKDCISLICKAGFLWVNRFVLNEIIAEIWDKFMWNLDLCCMQSEENLKWNLNFGPMVLSGQTRRLSLLLRGLSGDSMWSKFAKCWSWMDDLNAELCLSNTFILRGICWNRQSSIKENTSFWILSEYILEYGICYPRRLHCQVWEGMRRAQKQETQWAFLSGIPF